MQALIKAVVDLIQTLAICMVAGECDGAIEIKGWYSGFENSEIGMRVLIVTEMRVQLDGEPLLC